MKSKRLAVAGFVGVAAVTVATAALWAASPTAAAHHRPDHGAGPKPSPTASASAAPSPSASPSASASASPSPISSSTPSGGTVPPGGCALALPLPDTSAECTFTYLGGEVVVEATTTQTSPYCEGEYMCHPRLGGGTSVDLELRDGTSLAYCYTGYVPLTYGLIMPACAEVATPADVPVGTVLVCRGYTSSNGTFGCGSVREP